MDRFYAMLLNKKTFFRGSGILAFTTIIAYALGLLRDRMLAHTFGASATLSAYEAGFIVPDLIQNIFVAASLSAAFVPICMEFFVRGDERGSDDFVSTVLNGSLMLVGVVGLAAYIFAPAISRIVVPGFDAGARDMYLNLTRLLLLTPIIFAISNTLGSILVTRQKFFWYGSAAALYNLGTIFGVVFLAPHYGIMGVAYGTLSGALIHVAARVIGLIGHGIHYGFSFRITDYYRRFWRLMLPKMLGQPVEQLTTFGFTAIATTISAGGVVVLTFAQNFQAMPINVIGVALATTAFPLLSLASAGNNREEFRRHLMFTTKVILAIAIPATLLMFILRHFIIGLIFGGGQFSPEAVALTASTLGIFTLSITTECITSVLARGFYSLKNSVTPVTLSLIGLGIAVGTGYLFSRTYGVPGLALGYFAGSVFKVIMLSILLNSEIRKKLP